MKKPPVKMFGGEVKITHTSGETKSFKIDGKDERYERTYQDYSANLSENRVVKSTLQSGGTVLQNKPGTYNIKPDQKRSSPDVIRVYEDPSMSPSIEMIKAKFNFNRPDVIIDQNKPVEIPNTIETSSYKYTNIMDYSQNAIKQFTPKLKQPNLSIPGIPAPSKIILPQRGAPLFIDTKPEKSVDNWQKIDVMNISPMPAFPKDLDATDRRNSENIDFAQKQILLQQKMTSEPPKLQVPYNPMNVLVNGKIIRYVPGIPGPITADSPLDMAYSSNIAVVSPRTSSSLNQMQKPNIRITPVEPKNIESYSPKNFQQERPPIESNKSPKLQNLMVKTDLNPRNNEMRSPKTSELKSPKMGELKSPKPAESKSPAMKSPNSLASSSSDVPKKFARPNSLSIKPMMPGSKQHHGLTPTIFNQILISPDTPRVAKKYNHQILHGNYFSYLGLKSSTKPTYCTLNKTQPFYVPHFKKLSMYSEWTQRDTKTDKLFLSAYDSRQRAQKYSTAGKAKADLIIHSSYKFTLPDPSSANEEPTKSILGGYESNDDYTYVRGRGCFKTKGNLTKHMKSKAHTKNYAAYSSSSSSSSSAQQSGTPSSESDTDDSGMDSSDESSTRHQEREAVFGLLSLSQKPAVSENRNSSPSNSSGNEGLSSFMDTEQIAHVTKTNYAKNKILDQSVNFNTSKLSEMSFSNSADIQEKQKLSQFLGKSNTTRPLTYPYTNASPHETTPLPPVITGNKEIIPESKTPIPIENHKIPPQQPDKSDPTKQFNVVKKYAKYTNSSSYKSITEDVAYEDVQSPLKQNYDNYESRIRGSIPSIQVPETPQNVASDLRKRKGSLDHDIAPKIQKSDSEVIDLSISSNLERKNHNLEVIPNGFLHNQDQDVENVTQTVSEIKKTKDLSNIMIQMSENGSRINVKDAPNPIYNNINEENSNVAYENERNLAKNSETPMELVETNHVNINYVMHDQPNTTVDQGSFKQTDYDNSAMETLADIATKQEKLEKNSIAKNVASEFLKLAIKNECQNSDGLKESNFISSNKDVNELIGKPEENKSCTICSKSFCKPSQLKLHMNIHYLERPYRCDSCSVSFRTKGHLQKHERSASHHNKLSSSPNLSSSEPRPFKCSDCNIAFRIHGHLAKHLRAKMHIMKLECLNKIPFGLYAELERSNSLLTEINTTDGDQCLESLKMLAKKVFTNDPSKLNQLGPPSTDSIDADS
ncbi:schnurri isoform f [Holotrichia oblita]|uniref:Schnurri isoform f n=1 Tax=Holotrichia oblita TaxID=644536 RepID=A0ACB9TJB3_HOLOL|nr:schnurri isoform f [Holotrichia oblita]